MIGGQLSIYLDNELAPFPDKGGWIKCQWGGRGSRVGLSILGVKFRLVLASNLESCFTPW